MRLPQPVDFSARVVGRGWLTPGDTFLTLTPGESQVAGIRVAGLDVEDRSLRYEIGGHIDGDGVLGVDCVEPSPSQRRPELRAEELGALGCVSSMPYRR